MTDRFFEGRDFRRLAGAAVLAGCLCGSSVPGNCRQQEVKSWLCYYGTTFGPEFYSKFDLVVLDGHSHPPLAHLSQRKPILLGYLSIGEVDVNGPYWSMAEGKPYLARQNEHWESWMVDVRDPEWADLLMNHAVPAIEEEGFDGLFLDTLDSALFLEAGSEGGNLPGVTPALVGLIRSMKEQRPDMLIAVNRGLPILHEIAAFIDFLVVEDLYSYFSTEQQAYVRVSKEVREELLLQIGKGLEANPQLPVLSIDYATSDQKELIEEAIAFSRNRGFVPYVSTVELNEVYYHALDN